MATLKVYKKPKNFELPKKYIRLPLPNSTTNYTFCRELLSELNEFDLYQIGTFFLVHDEILYPEEDKLITKQVTYPKLYLYSIYVPKNKDLIYCMGHCIDYLDEPLSLFFGGKDIFTTTFDLDKLEKAHSQGRIEIIGQACLKRGGTLRVRQRKTDGMPFSQNDPDFERGNDINNDCFEILIPINSSRKSFFVYPDGVITAKGRVQSGVDSFKLLRSAYDSLKKFS